MDTEIINLVLVKSKFSEQEELPALGKKTKKKQHLSILHKTSKAYIQLKRYKESCGQKSVCWNKSELTRTHFIMGGGGMHESRHAWLP